MSRGAPLTALASNVVAASSVGRRRALGLGCAGAYDAAGLARSATRAPLPRMRACSNEELDCERRPARAAAAASEDERRQPSLVDKAMLALVTRRTLSAVDTKQGTRCRFDLCVPKRLWWCRNSYHGGEFRQARRPASAATVVLGLGWAGVDIKREGSNGHVQRSSHEKDRSLKFKGLESAVLQGIFAHSQAAPRGKSRGWQARFAYIIAARCSLQNNCRRHRAAALKKALRLFESHFALTPAA